jgi:hypothetical protein
MTTEDPSRADEMELELFLQRKGVVSRGLHTIDQPKSSDALEASIFAAIEAELNKEAQSLPQAANDPDGGANIKPIRRRFSPIWNIPLGLAAGVLLTVMVQKARHADEFSAPSVQSAQADKSKAPSVQRHDASAEISAPIAQSRPSEQTHPAMPPLALATPHARQLSHPTAIVSNKVERVEIIGSSIKRADAETASPVQIITSQDIKKSGATTVSDYLQSIPRKEATPCAPNSEWDDRPQALAWPITPTRTAEDSKQEQACLDLITEKLDDDADQEALEEWEKFRKTYPDYSAPDAIAGRIKELQKVQK